jgi:hypothetical protein
MSFLAIIGLPVIGYNRSFAHILHNSVLVLLERGLKSKTPPGKWQSAAIGNG